MILCCSRHLHRMFFAMRIECATKLANKNDIFADYKKNHIFFVSLNHHAALQNAINAFLHPHLWLLTSSLVAFGILTCGFLRCQRYTFGKCNESLRFSCGNYI